MKKRIYYHIQFLPVYTYVNMLTNTTRKSILCMTSGFFHNKDENCVLLGYYIVSSGNFLQTFWDNLSVPYSRVKNPSAAKWMRTALFWVIMPLKIGLTGCPKTSVRKYQSSLHNNPEQYSSQAYTNAKIQHILNIIYQGEHTHFYFFSVIFFNNTFHVSFTIK